MNVPSCKFQQAQPADLERIYPVELSAFPETPWPKDAFVRALQDPSCELQMAVTPAGSALGYVMLNYRRGGPGVTCIDSLGVSPEARGHDVPGGVAAGHIVQARS